MSSIILNSLMNSDEHDNILDMNNNQILNKNMNKTVYNSDITKNSGIGKMLKNLIHDDIVSDISSRSSNDLLDITTVTSKLEQQQPEQDDQIFDISDMWKDHQITFEIPTNLDLERINTLDNFTSLLHRIPSSVSSSSSSAMHGAIANGINSDDNFIDGAVSISGYDDINSINFGNILNTNDLINQQQNMFNKWSSSIVNGNSATINDTNNSEYQMIINYLWIGIVTSLVIMSIVFIVFSCYFYRKFREWKKCNKDIRAQLPNDLYPHVNGMSLQHASCLENGYYQMMESPPCYTIATGLPSYDEALMQATQNQQQQQQHQQVTHQYYPIHHYEYTNEHQQLQQRHPLYRHYHSHPHHHQQQQQQNFIFDTNRLMTSLEKPHISECNYQWDEGNSFETTNLVVINNLTDTINNIRSNNSPSTNEITGCSDSSNSLCSSNGNSNNNKNTNSNKNNNNFTTSNVVKEIENFPNLTNTNPIITRTTTNNNSNAASAFKMNCNLINMNMDINENENEINFKNENLNVEEEDNDEEEIEAKGNDKIIFEENEIFTNGINLKDNKDCTDIVVMS